MRWVQVEDWMYKYINYYTSIGARLMRNSQALFKWCNLCKNEGVYRRVYNTLLRKHVLPKLLSCAIGLRLRVCSGIWSGTQTKFSNILQSYQCTVCVIMRKSDVSRWMLSRLMPTFRVLDNFKWYLYIFQLIIFPVLSCAVDNRNWLLIFIFVDQSKKKNNNNKIQLFLIDLKKQKQQKANSYS